MKIQAAKLRFLPTLARYYAFIIIYNAVIMAIFMFNMGIGFDSPFFDRPEVHEKFFQYAIILLVVPLFIALIAIALRNLARKTYWIIGTDGIRVFKESNFVNEAPWRSIKCVSYYRNGRLSLATDIKTGYLKTGIIYLDGIQRSMGQELRKGISKRIKAARRDAEQEAGGSVMITEIDSAKLSVL